MPPLGRASDLIVSAALVVLVAAVATKVARACGGVPLTVRPASRHHGEV